MRLFVFLVLTLFLTLSTAVAQSPDSENLFREALICYGELNYSCTLDKLTQAEEIASRSKDKTYSLSDIYEYKAYTLVALGREAEAEASFRSLMRLNPDFVLSEQQVSPKIYRVYKKAKLEMETLRPPVVVEPAPKPEQIPEVAPVPEPPIEPVSEPPRWPIIQRAAGASAGAAFLVGNDTDYFNVGYFVSASAEAAVGQGFTLGGRIWFQQHAGKDDNRNLNVLGILFNPAWNYHLSRFWMQIPVAVGPVFFGWDGIDDRAGLIWLFDPAFFVRLHANVAIGLNVGPGGVVRFEPAESSTFLMTGLKLIGSW